MSVERNRVLQRRMYQFDQFNQPELFRIPQEPIHNERPPPLPASLAQPLLKSREDQCPPFEPNPVLIQQALEQLHLEHLTEYN